MLHTEETIYGYLKHIRDGGSITNKISAALKLRLNLTGKDIRDSLMAGETPESIMKAHYRKHPHEETSKRVASTAGKLLGEDIDRAMDDLRRAMAALCDAHELIEKSLPIIRSTKSPIASSLSQRNKRG